MAHPLLGKANKRYYGSSAAGESEQTLLWLICCWKKRTNVTMVHLLLEKANKRYYGYRLNFWLPT